MTYTYSQSLTDYKRARKLHRKSDSNSRFVYRFWTFGMPLVGCVALWLLGKGIVAHPAISSGGIAGLVILAGLAFSGLLVGPNVVEDAFKANHPKLSKTPYMVEYEVCSAEELLIRIPGHIETRIARQNLHHVLENEDLILLYLNKVAFIYVPKRGIPEMGIKELRMWYQTRGAC